MENHENSIWFSLLHGWWWCWCCWDCNICTFETPTGGNTSACSAILLVVSGNTTKCITNACLAIAPPYPHQYGKLQHLLYLCEFNIYTVNCKCIFYVFIWAFCIYVKTLKIIRAKMLFFFIPIQNLVCYAMLCSVHAMFVCIIRHTSAIQS